ncbi:MAG: hypothetical protein IKU60_04255 [Clostridia bacterium]|nr:hypothetical protein [Clostridia bacterium]
MKKKLLIGLGIFYTLIIVAVIAVLMYFSSYISAFDWGIVNPSNIKALYQGLTESPEVTAEKKKQLDSQRANEIKNYVDIDIREYTEEEKKQIESGEKSETQILAQIITETVEKNNETATENTVNKPEVNKPEVNEPPIDNKPVDNNPVDNKVNEVSKNEKVETAEQIIARHVSELYEIQSQFEGRVTALAESASNWVQVYKKMHPEQTWRDAKIAGVQYFSGTATAIENECYALVDTQMNKLKAELEAVGADSSIVATVKSTAYEEMDARKAQIVQEGSAKLNKKD